MKLRLMMAFPLALAAGACLPERNNPFDPANAPATRLVVRDVAGTGEPCSLAVASSSAIAVLSASRGHCLVLDASGTDDPHHSDLSAVTFGFVRSDASGNAITDPAFDLLPRQGPFVVLTSAYRLGLSTDPAAPNYFRVRATGDAGARRDAVAALVMESDRPVARTIPAVRQLPLGGLPWTPGFADVAFDGTASSDPDADPLETCWRFGTDAPAAGACALTPDPDGYICSAAVHDPCFTRHIDASVGHRVAANLRVRDPDPIPARRRTSLPVAAEVAIGDPPLWLNIGDIPNYGSPYGPLLQVDTSRALRSLPAPSIEPAAVAFLDRAGSPAIAIAAHQPGQTEYDISVESWPNPSATAGPVAQFVSAVEMAADPASGHVWVLGGDGATTWELGRWDVTADISSSVWNASVSTGTFTTPMYGGAMMATVDASGNPWVTIYRSEDVTRVDGAMGGKTILTHPGYLVAGVAARPGVPEVWVGWSGEAGAGNAELIRYDTAGNVLSTVTMSSPLLGRFGWVDGDALWVERPDAGLSLLSASALEADSGTAAAIHSATIAEADVRVDPSSAAQSSFRIDPVSGACWISDQQQNRTSRVSLDGRVDTFSFYKVLHAIDGDGALWYQDPSDLTTLVRGGSVSSEAVVRRTPAFGDLRSSGLDLVRGTVWMQSVSPRRLSEVTGDGEMIRSHSEGEPGFPPRLEPLRFAPGGESAWGVERPAAGAPAGAIHRLDLRQDPPRDSVVADATTGALLMETLEPAAPVAGQSVSWAWVLLDPAAPRLAILGTSGATPATVFTIPAAERAAGGIAVIHAERSMFSNSLCVGVYDNDAGENRVRLRRIQPNGTVDFLSDVTLTGSSLFQVFASSDPTDTCWVAAVSGTGVVLTGVSGAGVVSHTGTVALQATSYLDGLTFRAVSKDVVYVKEAGEPGPGFPLDRTGRVLRVEFTPGGPISRLVGIPLSDFNAPLSP